MAMHPAVRRWVGNIALLAGALVVSLLLFEVVLRIVGFSNPRFYEPNQIVGWRLHPGKEGWYEKEGRAYVVINSQGLRDREHALAKPPGTVRIAVLGDSYTEAFQLPAEQAYWSVLEREMNACPAAGNTRTEVINFGVSGYGTAQEYLTLKNFVPPYSPDIVLLAFFTGNDLHDNVRAFSQGNNLLRPFYVAHGETLEVDSSFRQDPDWESWRRKFLGSFREHFLSYHSRLHEFYTELKEIYKERREEKQLAVEGQEIGLYDRSFMAPRDDAWRAAWAATEGLLKLTRDEAAAQHVRLIVATLSCASQVSPDPSVRKAFVAKLGTEDEFYADRRIKQFCERNGIEVVTLAPLMLRYATERHVYLHGFNPKKPDEGHWNAEGHKAAGEILARYLCSGARTNPWTDPLVPRPVTDTRVVHTSDKRR